MDTNNKLTYSRTIEVAPEDADLLNHLVDTYILKVLEKRERIAQGGLPSKKLTPEEELNKILSFGAPPQSLEKSATFNKKKTEEE